MKAFINTKQFLVSLFLVFLGIFFLIMENTFYGYIDQNGVLQESVFLPLGILSFLLGMTGLIISIIWFYLKSLKKTSNQPPNKTNALER